MEVDARDSSGVGAGYQTMIADTNRTALCEGGDDDVNLLSLEQYEEAVQAGDIKAYKGKQYKNAVERYADGWRFNMESHRWQRLRGEQKCEAKLPE